MSFRLSVVIPTLNEPTLRETLEALSRQTRAPYEVIVVGRDETGITGSFSWTRFIDTGKPVCAAAARNLGIAASAGDVVVFTDSDCIPAPDWLERHLQAQETGREVVGGGVDLAGTNYWAQADNVSMFHEFVASHAADTRKHLPTLNLAVRREVFERVGPLDESFPGAAAEDMDWTIRVRLAGYRLHFLPAALVEHRPSRNSWADVRRHWRRSGYSGIRVRLRYTQEYFVPSLLVSPVFLRFCSPLIALWVTLRLYARPPLWRYLRYAPLVFLTKIIYCLGAASAIASGFAFIGEGEHSGE